ncbi:hypothetical protein ACFX2J_037054 [Malus domestica]
MPVKGMVLEFLPELFDTFRDEAYMLTESESAIFFPCLIEKAGCCKPSDDCGFTYESPISWTSNVTTVSSNPDCSAWQNDEKVLCFNCQSCKAGLLDNIKSNWKKTTIVNIVFLIFLIVVYSVGCCAFVKSYKSPTFWASRPNPEVSRKSRNTFGNPEFRDPNSFGSVSGYKIPSRNVLVWESGSGFRFGIPTRTSPSGMRLFLVTPLTQDNHYFSLKNVSRRLYNWPMAMT